MAYTVTDEMKIVLSAFKEFTDTMCFLGGSRVTAKSSVTDTTDYDYMVYVNPKDFLSAYSFLVKSQGFSDESNELTYPGDVISLRKGLTNIILTPVTEVFDKYELATTVCALMPEVTKIRRIEIFDLIVRDSVLFNSRVYYNTVEGLPF